MKEIRIPINRGTLKDAGYSPEQENEVFLNQLDDVLSNTRWYLDNAYSLTEYKLSWGSYKKHKITCPKTKGL